jgi:acyl-coenzyme A synthetase/AMP-(fatty) acid ligase
LRPAFGVSNRQTGTEDVALLVEVRDASRCQDAALQQRVAAVVQARTGVRPDRIELLEPGTLPKTTSGKMQRVRLREMLDHGRLPRPTRLGRLFGALPLQQRALSLLKLLGERGKRFLGWK